MLAITLVILISTQTLHTTLAAVTKHPFEEVPITYPESVKEKEKDVVPDQCKDLTYCTIKPKDYPEEKFNDMLKGHEQYRIRRGANQDVIADHTKTNPKSQLEESPTNMSSLPSPLSFNNRFGDPDDNDNCASEVTYEPLYKVREKKDQPWRTVIQAPGINFIQRIRIERCINPGASCFTVYTPLAEYVTYCKQKVNILKVLVSKGNNETEMIKAELPVCCSCHYKPVDF